MMQPICAEDVAAALAEVATLPPANGMVELAGPDSIPMDELVRRYLTRRGDARHVIADPTAGYFGVPVDDRTLRPAGADPMLGPTDFDGWLSHSEAPRAGHS